jgi:hypothetical protein
LISSRSLSFPRISQMTMAPLRARRAVVSSGVLFCGAPGTWPVRSLVSRVALQRGWRAPALRLLYVVKLSVEVR